MSRFDHSWVVDPNEYPHRRKRDEDVECQVCFTQEFMVMTKGGLLVCLKCLFEEKGSTNASN